MRSKPAISKLDGLRALLGAVVLAAAVALLTGAWLARGYAVDSGSMAPALLGPHADLQCSDCGLPFAVGVEDAAALARPAACPNCGALVDRAGAQVAGGDIVLVDRRAFQFRAPRRYEVVSLREPYQASQICVKRVVGLPGERVAIRDGDVFLNGQISRKNLAEQQAVALLVFDNRFQPRTDPAAPPRWRPEGKTSRWRASGSEFSAAADPNVDRASADAPATDDWLVYHHLLRVGDGAQFVESPVLDTQAYNQTRPIADPHEVRDLALELDARAEGPGAIYLRADDGQRPFICQLDVTTGQYELRVGERSLAIGSGPPLADGQSHSLYVSLFDRQALVAIDGQVVLEHAFDDGTDESAAPPSGVESPSSQPFAIATDCAALRITDLRILRDVYYTQAAAGGERPAEWVETQLADNEFYVLSDNSRLGLDSRYPEFGPAAPFNLLIGKPLTAHSRAPRATGGWGGIQVPAVWRIRYIR